MREKRDLWVEASPLVHVDGKTSPIEFINSSQARFHAGRDEMIKKLNALGIYSEVHAIPDTPHPFWFFNPWFEPTCEYSIQFLQKVFRIEMH
jgi:pectinesterase